ncbi:hypothetical protein SAMN06298212_1513 [Ruaniaceae bacterium KH17]|nr:hypothetical protein SAMN06298212_1513 [Ruaniaceae bacterium KH17]
MAAIAVLLACAGCSTQGDPPEPTTGAVESPASSADPIAESSTEPDDDPATPAPTLPADLPEPLADLVTEPVYPEAAREFTHDGAAAFIQYVMDASNWADATGDASFLIDFCSEESEYCKSVANRAIMVASGEVTRFGGVVTADITSIELYSEESDALIGLSARLDPYVDVDAKQLILAESEGGAVDAVFHAEFRDNQWRLLAAGDTP